MPTEAIEAFCARWLISELALFGSAARDELKADSDVDLMVTFRPEARWSLGDFVTMQDELGAIFGREVDLVQRGSVRNPYRRRSIERDLTVLYAA